MERDIKKGVKRATHGKMSEGNHVKGKWDEKRVHSSPSEDQAYLEGQGHFPGVEGKSNSKWIKEKNEEINVGEVKAKYSA